MSFSERMGLVIIKDKIQTDYILDSTKNRLWNIYLTYVIHGGFDYSSFVTTMTDKFVDYYIDIFHTFLKETVDYIDYSDTAVKIFLKKKFFSFDWNILYDFLEFSFIWYGSDEYIDELNTILEQDKSAYRILDKKITPITNDLEIVAIETTLKETEKFAGVHTHLKGALSKLSDKKSPDYRNSIKESISAVESVCNVLVGADSYTLAKSINKLDSENRIHTSLKEGFKKIYGYTSDSDGIRHFLINDGKSLKFEDAYFFLVTCSSFVHYLIQKFDQ